MLRRSIAFVFGLGFALGVGGLFEASCGHDQTPRYGEIINPRTPSPEFYVATNGNDATGTGSSGSPWATLGRAVTSVRARRAAAQAGTTFTIHLAAGTYQQTAVALDDRDSFLKIDGGLGAARLVGGRIVDPASWAVYSGSVQRTCLLAGEAPYTIIEDHVRATSARTPNLIAADPHYPGQQAPWCASLDPGTSSHTTWKHDTSCSGVATLTGVAATDVQVVTQTGGVHEWYWEIIPVASINTGTSILTLAAPTLEYNFQGSVGSRYYLQGALDWLDSAGEFYVDHNDVHGACASGRHYLYYQPRGNLATAEVIVPTTKDVLRVIGTDASHLVHDVSIDGVWFEASDFVSQWRYGSAFGQSYPDPPCTSTGSDWDPGEGNSHTYCGFALRSTAAANRHAEVFLQNVGGGAGINLTRDRFSSSGLSSVFGYGKVSGLTVDSSFIEKSGYDAWAVEGGYPSEGDVNNHNALTNSVEDLLGQTVGHGRCADILASGSNTVSFNDCGRGAREGVFVDGACASSNVSDCYAVSNLVSNNWIHDLMTDSADGGAIYSASLVNRTSAPYAVNFYKNNSVARILQNPSNRGVTLEPAAFYFDEDSNGQNAVNQWAFDVAAGNNIFVDHVSGSTVTWNTVWALGSSGGSREVPWATIGVDYSTFPYNAQRDSFADDFESGLGNWTTGIGSPTNTCAVTAHSGTHCFCVTSDATAIYKVLTAQRKKLTVWFYDDATATLAENIVRADAGVADYSVSSRLYRALGVDTSSHSTTYVSIANVLTRDSAITRTTGWHQLLFNFEFRDHMELSIDGVIVNRAAPSQQSGTDATGSYFNVVVLGDIIADGRTGLGCFDDVSVAP